MGCVKLNEVTLEVDYPLFRIDDSPDPLSDNRCFFMLESGSCHWQVEMEHMDMQK